MSEGFFECTFALSGDAAHDALDLVCDMLQNSVASGSRWDGLAPDVIELIAAQAALSAHLAMAVQQAQGCYGATALRAAALGLLDFFRGEQPARGERW